MGFVLAAEQAVFLSGCWRLPNQEIYLFREREEIKYYFIRDLFLCLVSSRGYDFWKAELAMLPRNATSGWYFRMSVTVTNHRVSFVVCRAWSRGELVNADCHHPREVEMMSLRQSSPAWCPHSRRIASRPPHLRP